MFRPLALKLCNVAWKLPALVGRRLPTVLTYHGVPTTRPVHAIHSQNFEKQVQFLKREFDIVPSSEALRARPGKKRVILTFDDGFRNNWVNAATILKKHQVPATFFISTRHLEVGKFLWCDHLLGIRIFWKGGDFEFHGRKWDMNPGKRSQTMREMFGHLASLKPHPQALYDAIDQHLPPLQDIVDSGYLDDAFAGMLPEQVLQLSQDPLFEIGNHTHDHPFLTRCDLPEARRQITRASEILQDITGKRICSIAYPIGDYNAEILEESTGRFDTGFAVFRKVNANPLFETPRFVISSDSCSLLGFKVRQGPASRLLGDIF